MSENIDFSQPHARVMFIEPRNLSVLGYDNFSDVDRSVAMRQAQKDAMPILSRPLQLLQKKAPDVSP